VHLRRRTVGVQAHEHVVEGLRCRTRPKRVIFDTAGVESILNASFTHEQQVKPGYLGNCQGPFFFAEQAAPITGGAGPHAQEWLPDPRHRAPASYGSRGPRDRKTAVQDRLRSVQQVRCFPSDCGASLKASVSFGEDVAMLPGQSFGGREVQSGPRTRHRAIAVYMFMRRHRLRAG